MKKRISILMTVMFLIGFAGHAHALLIDRGGGLIYDSDQDLTWLQDANYAQTSGFDAEGLMDWFTAVSWADGLVFGGFDDWRLPTITDNGSDGCNFAYSGTDCGYNVDTSGSEMAYMYYDNLGNDARFDASGTVTGCSLSDPFCLTNTGPFTNLQGMWYWSGTEFAPDTGLAWSFHFGVGIQGQDHKFTSFSSFAWAVRDGDVAPAAVPEPGTLFLLGTGLFGLALYRKRLNG